MSSRGRSGARLFDIREGEKKAVVAVLLLSFLIGIPRAFTFTVANTLFVEALGPGLLPWAYAVSAAVVAAAGLVYVRLEARWGLVAVGVLGALAFAGLLGGARLALAGGLAIAPVAFGLVVLTEAEFTFTNILFWGAANRIFTVRQAARLFGLVSVGQTAPAIAGGLAIPRLVATFSVPDLLFLSVAGHLGVALLVGLGLRRLAPWREPLPSSPDATRREGVRALLADPYLRGVALLIALQVLVFYAVDNAFYFAAEARLGRGEAMAAFLGRFLIGLGVASALFRLGVSGRWRQWLGLRSALASTPLTLLVLAVLALAATPLAVSPWAVFALVVVLKLWERVAVEAIHSPSYYSLFLPLPAETRAAAQSTLESVIAQGATVLGGVLLIAVNEAFGLGLLGLLIAITAGTAGWVLVATRLGARYREALRAALARRRLEPGALPIADATTIDLLEESARGEDPARVLRSFEILEELEVERLPGVALALLEHPHERVVEAAARHLERRPQPGYAAPLRDRLARGGEARTQARLARALGAAAGPAALPALTPLLEGPSAQLRTGAAIALARYGGPAGLEAGRWALAALARASSPTQRRIAARALGSAQRSELVDVLRPLIDDLDPEVARTALWASGRVPEPAPLFEAVLAALERPGMATEAARAAARFGAPALGAIAAHLERARRRDDPARRLGARRLLRVLGDMGGDAAPPARALLRTHLPGLALRHEALAALARAPAPPSPEERAELSALLTEELEVARLLLEAAREDVGASDPLLARGLRDDEATHRDRLLLLLGLLFDGDAMREARRHRAPGSADAEALALELVEAALPEDVAARVLPALEAGPPGPRLERLGGPAGGDSARARLAQGDRSSPLLARAAGEGEASALVELRALLEVELFEHLTLEQLALVARRAEARRFAPSETLLRLDDPEDRVVVLVRGRARWAGAGAPPAARVAPSDLALVRAAPRRRALVAETAGELLVLGSERLNDLFDDVPDAAWRVLEHLCGRARGASRGHATPAEPRLGASDLPYSELLRLMRELERLPALSRLPSATLAGVIRSAREIELPAGATLIEEGEGDATLYIQLEGVSAVARQGAPVARVSAPAILGELAAIVPGPRTATIRAETPVRALALPREALYALMQEDRGVLALVLELVVARLPGAAGGRPVPLRIPVEDTTL